jgi:predicted alpha/beta superfamily hydrolase
MLATLLLMAAFAPKVPDQALSAAPPIAEDSVFLGSRWRIHSAVLGEDREISVHLPATYDDGTRRYAVLYVLDGEQLFVPITGVAEALSWAYRAPPLIVVAIHNTNRVRDLTTSWSSATPAGSYQSATARAGGADRFLEFLRTELIPAVDRRYRTASFRILFGHSFGGLFALHAFTRIPGLFSATVASFPPAFWNGDEEIKRMAALLASQPGPRGYLFVSTAAREFDDTPRSVTKIDELLRLRAGPALHWVTRTIPSADHGTALLAAAQSGLELAFVEWRLPYVVFDEGLDSMETYYQRLSAEYGLHVDIPEGELTALAAELQPASPALAVRAFRRCVELYPSSITAAFGVAETLKMTGDRLGAEDSFARAIALAESSHDDRLDAIRRSRDSLVRGAPPSKR